MAYDDSMFRRRDAEPAPRDDSEYRAAYRPSHDAGYAPYAPAAPYEQRYDLPYDPPYEERYDPRYDPAARDEPEGRPEPVAGPAARRVAPAVLDDVFDDPEHGEPGRDRLAVHLGWEVVLLLAAGALAFLLYRDDPASLRGAGLTGLLVSATGLGLLTLGAGMTLRAGAVNLAIGPAAVAAALHFAENGDRGALAAVAPALLAGAVLGLAIAVLVGGLQVPGWAASLAGGLGVLVFIQQRSAPVDLQGAYDPATQAWYLFGGMA
ncbi:MAG TPA: hypothetical protein VES42_16200, partial [Pilimelia sp.]|nr:hypothetical protein [Pilimelia sp.]